MHPTRGAIRYRASWRKPCQADAGPRGAPGFSLIELLAVVLILGLVAAVALPNLGILGSRTAQDHALEIAASLEFARERAVMTGVPHRLVVDLDQGAWWMEWQQPEGLEAPAPPGPRRWAELPSVPMVAPATAGAARFLPVPGPPGSATRIPSSLYVESLETAHGSVQEGRAWVRFSPDGTAEAAELRLLDQDDRLIRLRVAPLAQAIRIEHGTG